MYTFPQALSPNRFGSPSFLNSVPATPGAMALDASDGRIDGKYFGSPIVDAGRGFQAGAYFPPNTAAAALDAADGVIDGKYFGARILGQTAPPMMSSVTVPSYAAGARLDAADGVLDGKYFGSQIVGQAPSMLTAPAYSASVLSNSFMTPPVAYQAASASVVLPPTEMSVITNVPPLGTTSVSVVDCHTGALPPPGFGHTHYLPQPSLPAFTQPPSFSSFSQQLESQTTIVKKEIPGAAAFAEEFRDLRAMLDRDRESFEMQRHNFERSLAERELKLKMDEEKLNNEWARFRAEEESFEMKKTSENTITVKTLQEGQALDVKDGIIDGKFNGKQIVVEGHGPLVPPPHLMGKPVPPPGKGGKGMPPGKGGKGMLPPGKGGMPPGKGMPPPGKGGMPPGKGAPGSAPSFVLGQTPQLPGAPGAPGKGGPPPAGKGGIPPGKGGKGGPPAGPPGGKGKGM